MDISFSSVVELKKRLMPALRFRKKMLKKVNVNMDEEILWSYFVSNYWKEANNLTLYEMVNDILNKEIEYNKDDII